MSEAWRRKSYYRKRILIQTQAVLDSPIPGGVVCLTGGAINMLRALLEYAERRSTFVTEYADSYYLAPTEAEWSELQNVVAETQEALVSCTDIVTQLACICDAVSGLQTAQNTQGLPGLDGQPDYDSYLSPVEEDTGDPPTGFATWDDWRVMKCKSAQMVLDDIYNTLSDLEDAATIAGAVTFAALETALVGSMVGIPLAIALLIVGFFTHNLVDWVWDSALAWVLANKQGLVCALYQSTTADGGVSAARSYIQANWDLPFLSYAVQWMFNKRTVSYIYDGDLPNYATRAGNYSASYCDECDVVQGDGWFAVPLDGETYYCEIAKSYPPYIGVGGWEIVKDGDYILVGFALAMVQETSNQGSVDIREGGDISGNIATALCPCIDNVGDMVAMQGGKAYQADVASALTSSGIVETQNISERPIGTTTAGMWFKTEGGAAPPVFRLEARYAIYEGTL